MTKTKRNLKSLTTMRQSSRSQLQPLRAKIKLNQFKIWKAPPLRCSLKTWKRSSSRHKSSIWRPVVIMMIELTQVLRSGPAPTPSTFLTLITYRRRLNKKSWRRRKKRKRRGSSFQRNKVFSIVLASKTQSKRQIQPKQSHNLKKSKYSMNRSLWSHCI